MKLLFLSGWYPYPPDNGSKLRIYNLIRGLAVEHEITLLSFTDRFENGRAPDVMTEICKEVKIVPRVVYSPNSAQAIIDFFSPAPRSIQSTVSHEMATQIQSKLSQNKYDCVIASQSATASYRKYYQNIPAIFEEVESTVFYEAYIRADGIKGRLRSGFTWAKYRQYMAKLLTSFDACTVVSSQEKDLVHRILPSYHSVQIVPNCVNLSDYDNVNPVDKPRSIIFTGSFKYKVNYNAMVWFIEEVYPLVLARVRDASLTITGDHAGLQLPSSPNVTMTGFVDDIRPRIAGSEVSIAPISQGGGTRLKILEAMALKTPVVATTKGAEGLDVIDRENILIADSPQDFADAVILLFNNLEFRKKLVDNAYKLIREKYEWQVVFPQFLDLVKKVVH